MVREINRDEGDFEIQEGDFANYYYEGILDGEAYFYFHAQVSVVDKWAYIHCYVSRFSRSIVAALRRDFETIKWLLRSVGAKTIIGTKDTETKKWEKFIGLLGFEDIDETIVAGKPCMMAIMEI